MYIESTLNFNVCVHTKTDSRALVFYMQADYETETLSYFCPETDELNSTSYHNDFATLILNRGELSITQIFHLSGEI